MVLDLRDIIEIPGAAAPFDCEISVSEGDFPSVNAFKSAPRAVGRVRNAAGTLILEGELRAEIAASCDRCLTDFEFVKVMPLEAYLAAELVDEEDPAIFLLEKDSVNLDEVISTLFILDMEAKNLCREDCRGLCPDCGENLNESSCKCGKKLDPRMAVLGQLLDNSDN